MSLFQNSVLNKYLKGLDPQQVEQAWISYKAHFHNPEIQENIRNSNEEQYQGEFLIDLFVNVLGYIKNPTPNFNLTTELKNLKGAKKTDGAILQDDKAIAVIELKGTNTVDLAKVETQAFGYKNNHPGCNYVITSNFEKLRLYIDNAVDFEEFNLFQLTKVRFAVLYLCLASPNLLNGLPKQIKDESLTQEENVTHKLYKDYSHFRNEIFDNIQKQNPQYDKLTLFKKTQKLLDRFLFIFFAEDRLLLPPNSIREIVNQWTELRDKFDEYFPLYDRFKKYFGYMNTGYSGMKYDIFAYNGGLFEPDEILDNIKINDQLLYRHTLNLSNYDFESEVSVNILGHIFEHSLTEIESIQAQIEGRDIDKSKTKRKKDGVFYTPKYITKYIVDNTVGKLCEEKKNELGIEEADYEKERKGRKTATLSTLQDKLDRYREWLLQLTICDPACGSGAFLNQALEFLIEEHQYIDELKAKLLGDGMVFHEVQNAILENNLFGVDINEESVEIAKLSLWLRTAQKGRKLTTLNDNIKCGNSLIDDPEVAGDKAFDWHKEFPEIFREKQKEAYHVVLTTHNSRTSQRMIDYNVKKGPPIELGLEEEIALTTIIGEIILENDYHCLAYNICKDHVHLVLVCGREELTGIVQKIKSVSSKLFHRLDISMGHDPLEHGNHLWSQKYYRVDLDVWQLAKGSTIPGYVYEDRHLDNAIAYIENNREKHGLPSSKKLEKIIQNFTETQDIAFASEYQGGFDVVIGNPPYGAFVSKREKEYYKSNYKVTEYNYDTYNFFFEKSIGILKAENLLGFITPNTFLVVENGKKLREFLFKENTLIELFEVFNVFPDAVVEPINIIVKKSIPSTKSSFNVLLESRKSKEIVSNNFEYSKIYQNDNLIFNYRATRNEVNLFEKIKDNSKSLSSVAKVTTGIKPYQKGKGKPKQDSQLVNEKPFTKFSGGEGWFPIVRGTQINRYHIKWDGEYILYGEWLAEPRNPEIFFKEKLLIRRTDDNLLCSYDNHNYVGINSVHSIQSLDEGLSNKYLLSIINSKVCNWVFRYSNFHMVDKPLAEVKVVFVERLPIILSNNQYRFIEKVDSILSLNEQLHQKSSKFLNRLRDNLGIEKVSKKMAAFYDHDFKTLLAELKKKKVKLSLSDQDEWEEYFTTYKTEINALQTEIEKTDREIDQMVYELYGLTEDEIEIVENQE